ncbi:NUDIX hydrolase [Pseudalkalibacillus sp. A8]|uniref:NUDIX hydrolase n=1 Tax=Pseudalkalibacillus sp. A8 TaxID=3382641 RepID=UPI0038B538D8
MWKGSAAVCIKDQKVLMVQQGKPNEKKLWTIPSGEKSEDESYEACCLRELEEETGYKGVIQRSLFVKKGQSFGIDVTVHYYLVDITGGDMMIQDPDGLIHDIKWVSLKEIQVIGLSFPEDLTFLSEYIKRSTL